MALELAHQAGGFLSDRDITNGRLEAEHILAWVLGLKRLDLYLQHDRPIEAPELERFREAVRRRLRHEPLQYILGHVDFRRLRLHVDGRVLIPRPETEVLVGQVLDWAADRPGLSVLDIGTGTGAIALSLAQEGDFGRIVATDASSDALDVARENATRCGLADRVEFRQGETWAAVNRGERYDIVVSNPPYIAESERATLQPEVRDWEPAAALFAGSDGMAVINELIDGAADYLQAGGLIALETGLGQGTVAVERLRSHGFLRARTVKDLTGRERMVLAERGPGGQEGRPISQTTGVT